jgi:hypothetical protein
MEMNKASREKMITGKKTFGDGILNHSDIDISYT